MKVSQYLDNLQNLLIKITVKVSSEKPWLGLLYEFPFSLNPGGKPNDGHCIILYLFAIYQKM